MTATENPAARQVHTGDESCPVRPLHDPCHTGCSEDGRTLDDMTAKSLWLAWRRQIRGTTAGIPLPADRSVSLNEVLESIELVGAYVNYSAEPMYRDYPLANLGDAAVDALCAIQHVTKDTSVTWTIFLKALAKTRSRVPGGSPFPPGSGMDGQMAPDNGIIR